MPRDSGFTIHDVADKPTPLGFVNPASLFGVPIPQREWVVQDWLPVGHVTLNYGDGGVGKTLLGQQLMTSCATGKPWCGLAVQKCRVLGLFCEDDQDELHRRQDAINDALGVTFGELEAMRWASAVGADNALVRFDRENRPLLTERFEEIERAALDFGAKLVVRNPTDCGQRFRRKADTDSD